ncbi:hypothetical protein BDZ97DRAFT_2056307 [Flammula alnicola]|nr:hypothetical protein BDZ97DRAFT_2056307 [Flammula alnicola]
MATILSLAPELVQAIACNVSRDDAKHLRLVCKQLGEFLESQVLENIFLNISKNALDKSIGMIRVLATSSSTGAPSHATRCLVIRSLSPGFDPNYWVPINKKSVTPTEDGPEVVVAVKDMKKYLFDALLSLKNLQLVRWYTERKDEEWAQNIVMSALKSIPSVQSLYVELTHARIPLSLELLPHLCEITLSEFNTPSDNLLNAQTYANLSALMAQSPPGQLTSIQVTHGYHDSARADAKPSLHELFCSYPADAQPLRLKHLGIMNSFVKFDDITVPHLRHLTSLDLSHVLQPRERVKPRRGRLSAGFRVQPTDPELYKRQCSVGSTVDELWTEFAKLGIWLKRVSLTDVVPAFFEYLACYSGLKKLSLKTGGFDTGRESDISAVDFFSNALTKHTGSLEELVIEASYEGLWCFGEHNISVITECRGLKHLGVSILSNNLRDSNPDSSRENQLAADTVDVLLATVSSTMPRLVSLKLYPADKEVNRGSWCGTGSLIHVSSVTNRITEHVRKYKVSGASCSRLPTVNVGGKTFEPERLSMASETGGPNEWQWH